MAQRDDSPRKKNLYLSARCHSQLDDLVRAARHAGEVGASASSVIEKLTLAAHARVVGAGAKFARRNGAKR